ncbi:uncharacterized protein [Physcomitrium patens]|uniref:Protein MAK16 homolog n=1 Tax=Physcomitrium patens TaxID=3218 RepID=A0A2K1LB79_PHYPA|nr:protein MAK16 homolog isoform X2 [Physcomitrium patens]PNR63271.1 hypothetical protein PHYPA_001696 [Physcomitrium patens]|eukprot:XP_024368866.1 protein MAK16 homolog isoform X2 [Physcomitrella patens]
MQSDEVVWQVINHVHCSFKAKMQTQNFCRNEYNVTGLCNRSSCPLANSRYSTIREIDGTLYLYMKSIERSHAPKDLWERVKLPRNYGKALETIDKHLEHWPKFLVHKNKQRLTKMTQYLIRMRKLALKMKRKLVTMPAKEVKREKRREAKALTAAVLDKSIEKELLQRLQSGTYGDIYNFPVKEYEKVLAMEEMEPAGEESEEEEEEEPEVEYVEGYEMEDEDEDDAMEDFAQGANRMPDSEDDDGEQSDEDSDESEEADLEASLRSKKAPKVPSKRSQATPVPVGRKKRRPHVEIEYEEEREMESSHV